LHSSNKAVGCVHKKSGVQPFGQTPGEICGLCSAAVISVIVFQVCGKAAECKLETWDLKYWSRDKAQILVVSTSIVTNTGDLTPGPYIRKAMSVAFAKEVGHELGNTLMRYCKDPEARVKEVD
jgi:hypothetical protein